MKLGVTLLNQEDLYGGEDCGVVAVGIQDANGDAWKNGDLEYSPSDDFYDELNKQLGEDWAELMEGIYEISEDSLLILKKNGCEYREDK